MSTSTYVKSLLITLFTMLSTMAAISHAHTRQRNTIYVLDCTGSMGGYNGSPNIWTPTKNFLKTELEKEAKENPSSKVTILPFQEKVLNPIIVDLNNINWPRLENVLDNYIKRVTATNICESWLGAEQYIDQMCDNYIILMTDGHDNIGGSANEANRTARLGQILSEFCGKYQNTKGFYVELTPAASLPDGIQNAIDICNDLYKIDASEGIPSFGCSSEDVININTRDLPADILFGFSNPGKFVTNLTYPTNPYVTFSIKDNVIRQGKFVLHVESKYGDNIEALNKAINAAAVEFMMQLESEDVIITNPVINVNLHTTPLRTLDMTGAESKVERTRPFLWIKGNEADTLKWNLSPKFNERATADNSFAMFRLCSDRNLSPYRTLFNGEVLSSDSIVIISPDKGASLNIIVPASEKDAKFSITLNEVNSNNLDRLNGAPVSNSKIVVEGDVSSKTSLVEILIWSILGLTAFYLLVWFGFIRNQKYPKFKRGIITIQSPYYATLRVRGYRMVVFTPQGHRQSAFDKLWNGKILYHTNAAWANDVEIRPSGNNMRFRCPSGTLICTPQPLLTRGMTFDIFNPADVKSKIVIGIS